jgi:hypothetical protein
MRRLMLLFLGVAAAIQPLRAQSGAPDRKVMAPEPAAQPRNIPPIPAELTNRTAALRLRVQPSVAAWISQQAKIEAGQRAFDLDALRATVRQHFAASLVPATGSRTPLTAAQANGDIDALVEIVMMEVANSADNDLNAMVQQVQAQMQAKEALRNLLDSIQQQEAAVAAKSGSEFCAFPICQQLSQRLSALKNQFAASVNLVPASNSIYFQTLTPVEVPSLPSVPSGPISVAQLNTIRNQLQSALDAENDLSNMESMELQMMMDSRSKFLQTVSDIEKSIGDTDNAVIENIKQ